MPASRLMARSPSGLPDQWFSKASGPAALMTERRARATTIASSAYPTTGMKSGYQVDREHQVSDQQHQLTRTPRGRVVGGEPAQQAQHVRR